MVFFVFFFYFYLTCLANKPKVVSEYSMDELMPHVDRAHSDIVLFWRLVCLLQSQLEGIFLKLLLKENILFIKCE